MRHASPHKICILETKTSRKGIPQAANEYLEQVISKIWNALGEAITEHDIEACHRVPARSSTARSNVPATKIVL